MSNLTEHVDLAREAGFTAAIAKVDQELAEREQLRLRKARLLLAYEFYRFVSKEKIQSFRAKLKERTLRTEGKPGINLFEIFDDLKFIPASDYPEMPPPEVMLKVKQARDRQIFDTFEVAKIESTREYKDPIVFGLINGCSDKFYIAQYDDDVRIEDLLGPNEG